MSMCITADEAVNAAIKPNSGMFAAITHIRDNDTFSRPPTDLRGSSCGMRSFWDKHIRYCGAMMSKAYMLSLTAAQNIPLPGVRGKYGKQIKLTAPHFCFKQICGVLGLILSILLYTFSQGCSTYAASCNEA